MSDALPGAESAGQRGDADPTDVLAGSEAGGQVIRGTVIRSAGYVAGLALTLLSASLLTRHLGVIDFGHYVTVGSLIAIATILTDAGLTAVGVREYAVRDAEGRGRLMRNLVAVRLIVALFGAAGVVLFTLAAGYANVLLAGVALGGIGLVVTMAQRTYVIPLIAELRLGPTTLLDLLRQLLTLVAIIALVVAGAGLLAFFVIPIPVGIAVLAATVLTLKGNLDVKPKVERKEWRYLVAETLPAAAASTAASLFYRVAIVMMSLIATGIETGYFSASFRVVEAFVAVPSLLVGSAYPVLSRAADTDRERLAHGFQRLFDVCLILGAWVALALAAGARLIMDVIAGHEFRPAVPVLQIQGPALAATFLVALFGGTLWVVRAKRELVLATVAGVLCAMALTAVLVPLAGAKGAAVSMTSAEVVLAGLLGLALLRPRPELRPSLKVVPKVILALVAGASLALLHVPTLVVVLLGTAAYFGVLVVLGGIPKEIWQALGWRRRHRRGR